MQQQRNKFRLAVRVNLSENRCQLSADCGATDMVLGDPDARFASAGVRPNIRRRVSD